MSKAISEYNLGGNRYLRIYPMEYPCDPREDDNLGSMVCWHNRYQLGDVNPFPTPERFINKLLTFRGPRLCLDLYLYDHSGITISTKPFGCRFDSGRVGYIYVDPEKVRQEFSVERISTKLREKVIRILESEVEVYDQYLRGDVYGFVLEKESICDTCQIKSVDQEDSCWGFFGDDITVNGILDHLSHEDALKVLEQVNG